MLRFALPPSLGTAEALARARGFGDHLGRRIGRPVSVVVAPDYKTLQSMVADGVVDAAWAPPFVCARLELRGLRVAVRGNRGGASSYRAALVCRRGATYAMTAASLKGARAAWVDRDSVGGYLLVSAMLKANHVDPINVFSEQKYLGSYREALKAVAEERADVTSIFAAPGGSFQTGITEALPERADDFALIAYSEESPNDGVVLSSAVKPGDASTVTDALLALHDTAEGKALLTRTFRIDRFDTAQAGGYRSLYRLVFAAH